MTRVYALFILSMMFLIGIIKFNSIILAALSLLCAFACEYYLDKTDERYQEFKKHSK